MCYNTKLTKKPSEIESRFKAVFDNLESFKEFKEISAFTHSKTPIITSLDADKIQLFQWGLIPNWATSDSIKKHTLNARIETLSQKPSFKNNLENRCIILANGFYEWQWLDKKGKTKQKYEIGLPNNNLFAFAGLWSNWFDEKTQENIKTYTIITTEAQGVMKNISNHKGRMPVVLSEKSEKSWLLDSCVDNFKKIDIDLIVKKTYPENLDNPQLSIFS